MQAHHQIFQLARPAFGLSFIALVLSRQVSVAEIDISKTKPSFQSGTVNQPSTGSIETKTYVFQSPPKTSNAFAGKSKSSDENSSTEGSINNFRQSGRGSSLDTSNSMTPAAYSLAKQLDLLDTIQKIRNLKRIPRESLDTKSAIELLSLTQSLDYKLTITSLEIADVISEIDSEDARADEMRSVLEDRRTEAQKLNSYANLLGSGALGIVAAGVGIGNNQLGNILGTTDGSVNATLAAEALRKQRDAGNSLRRSGAQPNMLAAILDQPTDDRTAYPQTVWTYLNEKEEPQDQYTRRQKLIQSWIAYRRLAPLKTPQSRREIPLIAGTAVRTHDLTINVLDDRSAMLSDLRAVISTMNRSLLKLMLAIKSEND